MTELYPIDQIKAAFWEEFHGSGEIWFGEDADDLEERWESFLDRLGVPERE